MRIVRYIILIFCCLSSLGVLAGNFRLQSGRDVSLYVPGSEPEVVHTASGLLAEDFHRVFGANMRLSHSNMLHADLIMGLVSDKDVAKMARRHGIDVTALAGSHEAFVLKVVQEKGAEKLLALGSDKRGLAYAMMHLSRLMGVSPWYWWADVTPLPMDSLVLPADYEVAEQPDVAYRGIFINDEDWGMMPWASLTFEPTGIKGDIGPKTHEKIFELMLRLRANVFWPAMHDCSRPFYLNPANQRMADKYGIIVSTSHCEPMMCNANGEWRAWANDPKGVRYNYVTNADSVNLFWQQRVKQLKGSDCIYTLGMRGIHDGPMQGAKSIPEQVTALTDILASQRNMLRKEIGKNLTQIPQQFVPYKEVLDCYHQGLEVPDDVTLIWCDDNYGYIRHLPTEQERLRTGGNGVYYHLSYWGRPHDYLWLSTIHPELMRSEMLRAYDHGIDRMWILNVGDIKPAEYEIQLYMDMAWETDRFRSEEALNDYCKQWYKETIGYESSWWTNLWSRYYDLAFDFKPEWMGGTRTEEKDPRWKQPADLPLNEREIRQRYFRVQQLALDLAHATTATTQIPESRRAAAFELLEYPIACMVAQNEKWLSAQLARHGMGSWRPVKEAHQRIVALTQEYNEMLDGKWRGMMDMAPRRLADFAMPADSLFDEPMPAGQQGQCLFRCTNVIGQSIPMGESFRLDVHSSASELEFEIQLLPVHPANDKEIRIEVSVDGKSSQVIDYHTEGRSEEWKINVLHNRAVRRVTLSADSEKSAHELVIRPVDEEVKVQCIYIL